jgi:hypothetical protein
VRANILTLVDFADATFRAGSTEIERPRAVGSNRNPVRMACNGSMAVHPLSSGTRQWVETRHSLASRPLPALTNDRTSLANSTRLPVKNEDAQGGG